MTLKSVETTGKTVEEAILVALQTMERAYSEKRS